MTGTDVSKWADSSMFQAEKVTGQDPVAYLLGGPVDPLGQIAACALMYQGVVVRDLADITEEQRKDILVQMENTVLKMPLEAVSLHFMLDNVHRGITHQMVRQRTAAYAQESTRFAVKEDFPVALPPSLADTQPIGYAIAAIREKTHSQGIEMTYQEAEERVWKTATPKQRARFRWDQSVENMKDAYLDLVNAGIPAEDARGLMPTNILTRLNYITNLRSLLDTLAVRVSDQAQFEWRMVARAYALAMRAYGAGVKYRVWIDQFDEFGERTVKTSEIIKTSEDNQKILVERNSYWQYVALTEQIKPVEFKIGGPAFNASFDRPSRIYERVAAFKRMGVPSSRWTQGAPEHNIPAIHPDEWLLDPNAARLPAGFEFDLFGNRVPANGEAIHWFLDEDGHGYYAQGAPAFKL